MDKRLGRYTVKFSQPPVILATAAVVGPKEGAGPLRDTFDLILPDTYWGETSWELTERKMLAEAVKMALEKATLKPEEVQFLLAGDLLNQTISANFMASQYGIPFLGLYGACSTMFEGLSLAAMLIDGGFADHVIVAASSHYGAAERQYRLPTEQATQRPMSAQWTVTGAGAIILGARGQGPRVTMATVGRVLDLGVKDAADMGGAMAPAASDTLVRHLQDTGRQTGDYDLIITGDLGKVGSTLIGQLAGQNGYQLGDNYQDGGLLIYDIRQQDTHAGGSGCACSAVVTAGYIYQELQGKRLRKVLGIGTGSLQSPTSVSQGESIPGIGHAVVMEA
ncbi:MAG: stage V sporulation protein AD [Clostridia bacterium]|nr:MAG: stage V sporulation protein AD [Clostridia bacterium]